MKTITFDTEKAKKVEEAVCSEFGFSLSDIVSFRDAVAKKVVVFLLIKYLGCDNRMVGRKYQMSYLYVPTVVAEMEEMERVVAIFKVKIVLIINQLRNEKVLD